MKAQRLRVRFAVGESASRKSHRELLNEWGEAARRAGLTVAYSAGKRPAPQISVAALLPQGVTGGGEVLDIYLDERADPATALERLRKEAPEGITVLDVEEVGPSTASVQAQLRWAEYEVEVPLAAVRDVDVEGKIAQLLTADSWPAEYRREKKVRSYDLRPLVLDLAVVGEREGALVLRMALRAEQDSSARADQVLVALGLPEARRIHRTALHLDRVPEVVLAHRRESGS